MIAATVTAPEPISVGTFRPSRSIQLGGSTTIGASLLTTPGLIPATMVNCWARSRSDAPKTALPPVTVFWGQLSCDPAWPTKQSTCCTPSGTATLTVTCSSTASQPDPVASQYSSL